MVDTLATMTAADDAGHRAKQDAMLARIETERLIPGWAKPAMLDTVDRLRQLPAGYQHVTTGYLAQIVRRGHGMFPDQAHYQAQLYAEREAPTIRCRCGTDVKADPPTTHHRVASTLAVCPACGIAQAMFDGELYDRPTLITAIMH